MDENKVELSKVEREVIGIMLKQFVNVIELCDGYLDIHGETFNRNDFYDMCCKLNIEDLY